MTAMTDYLENNLIDHIFRGSSYTKPSTIYVGLFTSATADDGTGTEVSGGSYARVQVGPANSAWTATQGGTTGDSTGTDGQTDNAADITFPTPTADWGTVSHFAILDASSGGNMLIHGALNNPKTVNNGDAAPKFNAGDLNITFA